MLILNSKKQFKRHTFGKTVHFSPKSVPRSFHFFPAGEDIPVSRFSSAGSSLPNRNQIRLIPRRTEPRPSPGNRTGKVSAGEDFRRRQNRPVPSKEHGNHTASEFFPKPRQGSGTSVSPELRQHGSSRLLSAVQHGVFFCFPRILRINCFQRKQSVIADY